MRRLLRAGLAVVVAGVWMAAPAAGQESKDKKSPAKKEEAKGKTSGSGSAKREKIKASSGDEAGTAKGTVSGKK